MGLLLDQVFDLKEEEALSAACDASGLQDSACMRAMRRARRLATFAIDEKGELQREELSVLLEAMEKEKALLARAGYSDGPFVQRLIRVGGQFLREPRLWTVLKQSPLPLCHKRAEKLIHEALALPLKAPVTNGAVRRAIFSACLAPLRQSVGSCFATAPAILIHEEQLELFLSDLTTLLATGQLKRTFEGVEYGVPLSFSAGIGDLKKAFSPFNSLSHSLGLRAAASSMGEKLQELLARHQASHAEEWIRTSLLEKFGLSAQEIERLARYEKSPPLHSSISGHKWEAWHQFQAAEEEARAAFKAVTEHALLRSWEYTLASFSESKLEFARWNLQTSLGLDPRVSGGVGALIYRFAEESVARCNVSIESAQLDYQIAFDELCATESLLRQASTEAEIRRLQAEHIGHVHHMRACQDKRDAIYAAGTHLAELTPFLIEQYRARFSEYFQEVYDPAMHETSSWIYDDRPAGFRLVSKRGRSDPGSWIPIASGDEWLAALLDFFITVEPEIAADCSWEGGKQVIAEVTSAIALHLKSEEFLKGALQRVAKEHNPEDKPWAYNSGGNIDTLLKVYFKREMPLTRESRWVESPADLLIFLLETLKSLPPRITDPFIANPRKGMLITSPTHAFILHPGWEFFKEGWQEEGFSYTWVRDRLLHPGQNFYASMHLSTSVQSYLAKRASQALRCHLEPLAHAATPAELRIAWLSSAGAEAIDAFLFEALPVAAREEVQDLLPDLISPLLTAKELRDELISHTSEDHEQITRRLEAHGLRPPPICFFADTNWNGWAFAFLVNPGTGNLELWRIDRAAAAGLPMHAWAPYLSGIDKSPWTVYVDPMQYG